MRTKQLVKGAVIQLARVSDWSFDGIQMGLDDAPHSANFTNQSFLAAHHGMTISVSFPVTAAKLKAAMEAAEKRATGQKGAAA